MVTRHSAKEIVTDFSFDLDDERSSTISRNSHRTLIQLGHSSPFTPSKAAEMFAENDELLREVSGDEIFLFLLNQRRMELESQSSQMRLENSSRMPAHCLITSSNLRNQSQCSTWTASPSGANSVMSDMSSISAYSFRSEHHVDSKIRSPQQIQICRKKHFTDAEQLKSHLPPQCLVGEARLDSHEEIDTPPPTPEAAHKRSAWGNLGIRMNGHSRRGLVVEAAADDADMPAVLGSFDDCNGWGKVTAQVSSTIAADDNGSECDDVYYESTTMAPKKKKKRFSFMKKLVPNFLRFRRKSVSLPLPHPSSYTTEDLEEGKDHQEQNGHASMMGFTVQNILQPWPTRQPDGDCAKKKSSRVVTRRTTL